MKYLLTNIKNVSHLVRSICSSPQSTWRIPLKSNRAIKTIRLFGAVSSNMKYKKGLGLQMYNLYSTSSRETFKAKAPIGVYQNSRNTFRLHLLGMRLGESFNRLSQHINLYFKQKQVSVIDYGQNELISAVQEPLIRTQRRVQRERRSGESRAFIGTPSIEQVNQTSSNQPLTSAYPGLQLFHISSMANRFGETYSYVANHINSVFSRNPAKQIHVAVSSDDGFRRSRSRKRRVMGNKSVICKETEQTQQKISLGTRPEIENYVSSSWEELYLHFASHVNRYFGAKVADTAEESPHVDHELAHTETNTLKTSVSLDPLSKTKRTTSLLQPKSPGLFHMSSLTTRFGENYTYMANHVNLYFKRSSASDCSENEEVGEELYTEHCRGSSEDMVSQEKTVPFFECLLKPSTLPGFVGSYLGMGSSKRSDRTTVTRTPEEMLDKTVLKRRKEDEMTRFLLNRLEEASVPSSITSCVEKLNTHLIQHPACKAVVWQVYNTTLKYPRAVLAFMLGLVRITLDECEEMYHRFGTDVFRQNPLVGTVKMGWTHSYYNTETWEMILREKMGQEILIKTARDELSPKVSAVSAVVNWGKSPKAFIFRNYNHAPGRLSRYAGGSGYRLWQAVRASSAAPGYFQEFPLHGDIHQDGGLILNNPCALAVHESRLLWPNQHFQCVLSLGTGRYDNARRGPATSTSLRAKISNLICSATDTEGVHTLLDDLLSPNVYFRFNPMLSSNVTLDESRPEVLQQLQKDTQLYLDRNRPKLQCLCDVLMAERTAIWKARDWMGGKAWELQQRWA
ncbi:calcium-independent phospholipase A2-gamma-like [Pseudorasbora parva]|uniref:calcium-independent phospholipase A2-gamma-like n=1 Tax=Pseudorasbora parva TaxID=51549 RepID=UPI00351E7145